MSTLPPEKDAERLVRVYRRIREAREQNTSEYNKKDAEFKAQMEQVGKLLIALMDEQGALGLKTSEGTVSKVVKNRFWNVDWPEFNKFVKANDLFDLFEKRLAQKNVAEYLAANPTVQVPGLQIDRRFDVMVRKPTDRGGNEE